MAQHFAIRTRPTRPAMMTEGLNDQERASFARHAAWLKERIVGGVMIVVGRTRDAGPDTWTLAIIKADSEEEAQRIMSDDPFVQDGVVEPELFAFDLIALEPQNA
jgi:uncharacterized protein YciI